MIEPAFIEEGFHERDDSALIMGREIGGAAEPVQESRSVRAREIITHRRQPKQLVGRDAERAGAIHWDVVFKR